MTEVYDANLAISALEIKSIAAYRLELIQAGILVAMNPLRMILDFMAY